MKKAFTWLLRTYLLGFLLFLAVQIVILFFGIRFSLTKYAGFQQEQMTELAREILVNPQSAISETLSYSNSFFVFSADKTLVFSNRGRGRSILQEELKPVLYDDAVIGYYYSGETRFADNEGNRIFLNSLTLLLSASLIVSLAVGLIVSVFAARKIAAPVNLLLTDIGRIGLLKPVPRRAFEIAELSLISEELEKLAVLLIEQDDYKRRWMQDIAHDLRTPISGLKSQLEAMRDGVLEPSSERFEKNLGEVNRLQDMVRGIGELYSVENITELKCGRFPAREFMEELLHPFEAAELEKGLRVSMDIPSSALYGERDLLLRGIGNIAANAYKFTPDGGGIDITLRANGEQAVLEIANDTPRPGPADPERLFRRFYREDYARNTPGTGLGLNIAREIIGRHGGTVTASNGPGGRIRFTVVLPLSPETV